MNINFLPSVSSVTTRKTDNNRTIIRNQGLKNDTFIPSGGVKSKEPKKEFNSQEAINELKSINSFNGKPKFNDEKLTQIKNILDKQPEKWDAIKTISAQPKMISTLVLDFANRDLNTLNAVAKLSEIKKDNGEAKFSSLEIRNLTNQLQGEELLKVCQLSSTPLSNDNIIEIAKNKNIPDIKRIINTVNNYASSSPDMRRISFIKDEFDDNAYNVRIDMKNNGSKIILLDKALNETALEVVSIENDENGHPQQVKNTNDFRNNTISKVISMKSPSFPQPIVTEETRIIKNSQGQVLRKELYTLSDLAGIPNIKYVYPNGEEKIISSGHYDENTGKTTVTKDMKSLDGTRTQYLYEDEPNGNMHSSYKITDKNGNVLLNKTITFKKLDENTFISTENDKKYEVKFSNGIINITNMNNGEVSTFNFDEKADGDKEKLLESFKQMPAEEIIALNQNTDNFIGIKNIYQSTYAATTRTIKSGDNLFTILHEAGHAKDYANVDVKQKETLVNSIFSNPEVNKVFEEEKAAFNKAFPLAQRDHISYFIKTSEYKDGIQEAIAETNAILNTKQSDTLFSIRTQYLQQYFPKTIAYLATIID